MQGGSDKGGRPRLWIALAVRDGVSSEASFEGTPAFTWRRSLVSVDSK